MVFAPVVSRPKECVSARGDRSGQSVPDGLDGYLWRRSAQNRPMLVAMIIAKMAGDPPFLLERMEYG